METRISRVITIGLSDPIGINGVQADLKTFSAFGVHGASVITGVMTGSGTRMIDPIDVASQLDMAVAESGADAIKIGALGNSEVAEVVAGKVAKLGITNIVIDPSPVLSEQTDDEAAPDENIVAYLKSSLLPLGGVVVVDIPECKLITGLTIKNAMGMKAAGKLIHRMGARCVVVSGSELGDEECIDYMFDGEKYFELPSERIETPFTRGSGAAYSAAITAGLAYGRSVEEAAAVAKMYITEALATAYSLENETGSIMHLYAWWEAGGSRGYGG
jgi:hydroxymethylpyrimidine/phosphomethylpyrimidine kinase